MDIYNAGILLFTALLAYATSRLVTENQRLWKAARRSADIADRDLGLTYRPFVVVRNVQLVWRRQLDTFYELAFDVADVAGVTSIIRGVEACANNTQREWKDLIDSGAEDVHILKGHTYRSSLRLPMPTDEIHSLIHVNITVTFSSAVHPDDQFVWVTTGWRFDPVDVAKADDPCTPFGVSQGGRRKQVKGDDGGDVKDVKGDKGGDERAKPALSSPWLEK